MKLLTIQKNKYINFVKDLNKTYKKQLDILNSNLHELTEDIHTDYQSIKES